MKVGASATPTTDQTAQAVARNAGRVTLGGYCSCNGAKAAAKRSSAVVPEKTF